MATIYLQAQGKGGVGKSIISVFLAQYFIENNINVKLLDCDTVNPTFSSFEKLNAVKVPLGKTLDIVEPIFFDAMFEMFDSMKQEVKIIIDIGSSTYLPLLSYMKENKIGDYLRANGHDLKLLSIVIAGAGNAETIQNLVQTAKSLTSEKIILILNEYFGEIAEPKSLIDDFPQIETIIKIPQVNALTYGVNINDMLTKKQLFNDVIGEKSKLNKIAQNRVKIFRDTIFTNFDNAML